VADAEPLTVDDGEGLGGGLADRRKLDDAPALRTAEAEARLREEEAEDVVEREGSGDAEGTLACGDVLAPKEPLVEDEEPGERVSVALPLELEVAVSEV
jgi:hypothetical protein